LVLHRHGASPRSDLEECLTTAQPYDIALVLSGGNALGAYQAGAYEALHDHGMEPSWIAGASAGAVNGAIICGNAPEHRIDRLRALWTCGPARTAASQTAGPLETMRRSWSAVATLALGRPGLFIPRHMFGPWWNPLGNDEPPSLYDLTPLNRTLRELVDFVRLNAGGPRLCVTAVDILNGEDIAFDTARHELGPDHIRASASLLPAFPPVEINGRLLGDAGISANLPIDIILSDVTDRPLLCIAVDLLPLEGRKPRTLRETADRMQDLLFATQSRRALAAWEAIFDARGDDAASVTLLRLTYSSQDEEVAGKAFDFSPPSAAKRWDSGYADMTRMLSALAQGAIETCSPGLAVYQTAQSKDKDIVRVHTSMRPSIG